MTNDEMQKLAAGLADCGKALLRVADALMEKRKKYLLLRKKRNRRRS